MLAIGAGPAARAQHAAAPSPDSVQDSSMVTVNGQGDPPRDARNLPTAARAFPAADSGADIFSGNYLIVGVGAIDGPSYEGAHTRRIIPALGLSGRIKGIGFTPRSAGFAFNVIPPRPKRRVWFAVGPVIRFKARSAGRSADPVLAQLPNFAGMVEAGVNVGISVKHLLNPYDSLSLSSDVRFDVTRHTGSIVVAPGLNYLTPVSRRQVVGLTVSGDFVNDRYAQTNYAILAASAQNSGLPAYTAHGGLKSVGARMFSAFDITRDIRRGGIAIGLGVGYSLLAGSAAQNPRVRMRGQRGQIQVATGIAYAF